ncbi:MAG: sigma-70 family RNA polymerase sigma factor [Clostridiales bacterium]|jgi:RNA polymerase sigma-70 factor (ECF subfamily)|nr:sigma-70 family RNA polymerase sigma factor [Clostridia bacterium]NLH58225.1 sigma-70 family RNA polymerase sigma factor [Clostridiales bacterium]
MEPDIGALIGQLKKKKEFALEQVMDIYMDPVYSLASTILRGYGQTVDIEECVQDVFIDAWNKISEYDPGRGKLKTWLLILCKYKALSYKRRLSRQNRVFKIEDLKRESQQIEASNVEASFLAKEERQKIIEAIRSLPDLDRQIFLRVYILDESIEEVSKSLGLSRQAVDNRLWRGRKALRKYFKNTEGRDIIE